MAGHRRGSGKRVVLVDQYERRRDRVARVLAEADSARARLEAAYDYLRGALASTDRRHRALADEVTDRAAYALRSLADELYETAIKERKASR